MIQEQIYKYFDRNEDMHILFIFDRMGDINAELSEVSWNEGYRYITFDGKWFTTKYKIHNEWKNDKIVLLFPSESNVI